MSIYLSLDCIEVEYWGDQWHHQGGGVMTPKNGISIYLSVTTASDSMSVDNTCD